MRLVWRYRTRIGTTSSRIGINHTLIGTTGILIPIVGTLSSGACIAGQVVWRVACSLVGSVAACRVHCMTRIDSVCCNILQRLAASGSDRRAVPVSRYILLAAATRASARRLGEALASHSRLLRRCPRGQRDILAPLPIEGADLRRRRQRRRETSVGVLHGGLLFTDVHGD